MFEKRSSSSWDQETSLLLNKREGVGMLQDEEQLVGESKSGGIEGSSPGQTAQKSFLERVGDWFRGLKHWTAGDWFRLVAFVSLIVGIIVVVGVFHSDIKTWLTSFLTWVRDHQLVGAISLAVVYVAATILFVPAFILTLGGGFAFDLWVGIVTISIGSTLGACCAFLLGRYFARDWIAKKISNFPIFLAIDGAIADKGALIVFLLRLSPVIPFNLLNYALGLTRVDFWVYFPISWIGMLPGTILYVYIGHGIQNIADVVAGNAHNSSTQIFLYVGLGVTFYLVFIVSVIAKNAISRALLLEKVKKLKENDPSLDDGVIEVFKSLNPEPELESFIIPGRKLLKEGPLDQLVEKKEKTGGTTIPCREGRYLFLFNDALLLTVNESRTRDELQESTVRRLLHRFLYGNESASGNNSASYWLRTWVSLPVSVSETTVPITTAAISSSPLLLSPSLSQPSSFKIQTSTSTSTALTLIASNPNDRHSWMEAIQLSSDSTRGINHSSPSSTFQA